MTEFLLELELAVLNFINNLQNPISDSIMVFITHLGDKGLLWIALGLTLCFIPKHKRAGECLFLALLINFVICNLSLKPLIARLRPYEYVGGIKLLISEPGDFSFPSGHSSSSFASAVSVWLYNKKLGTLCLIVAYLIAFSRLYIYVHFPSDVISGIIIGIFSALISEKIISKSNLFSS